MHVHIHAKSQMYCAGKPEAVDKKGKFSQSALMELIDSLETTVKRFGWKSESTEWGGYYSQANYSDAATESKANLAKGFLSRID